MVRDRAGRAACHRLLEHPQAPLCLGPPTAPSQPASPRYRGNAKSRIDLADAPLSRLPEVLRHARAEPLVSGWTHPDRAIRRSVGRSVDACCKRLSKRTTPDFIGAFGQLPRLQKVRLLPSLPSMRV